MTMYGKNGLKNALLVGAWILLASAVVFTLMSLIGGCSCSYQADAQQQSDEIIVWSDSVITNYELPADDVVIGGDTVQIMPEETLKKQTDSLGTDMMKDIDKLMELPDGGKK